MINLTRRGFLKLGSAIGAIAILGEAKPLLAGTVDFKEGWLDYSHETGKNRQAIPSACWQCVGRDGIVGYVEDGRLMKIEGNPNLKRTNGKLCSKGQAGVNQVYDPDRILYPMKRVGKRGEGNWKRISWDQALDEVTARLKKLLDKGEPEKFMFHYGRMKGSDGTIVKSYFLPAYGTKTIGNHTSICEGAKWTSQELVWGGHYDVNDVARTKYILNFGCNFFETHTSHVPFAQRAAEAIGRGVPLVTFDVRLSNTAAKSREWFPIKPGTDSAVMLAMANVILNENLYSKDFIEKWTNVTIEQLKDHVSKNTPEWAEKESTVPAAAIRRIAREYAKTRPSTLVTYRGAVAHYNGVETERIAQMLEALVGNINIPGGRVKPSSGKWKVSFKKPKGHPKGLKISDGKKGLYAYPTHHANHQVLKMIKDGSAGRPEIYMIYCYNPAYVNGNVQENIDILKDESLIPYFVAVDPFMSESTELADLILPDVTYLERWTLDDMVSYDQIPEWFIRQPVVKALGESRQFQDVVCDLAQRLGGDVAKGVPFRSAEEFVKDGCGYTKEIKAIGGFEYMKKYGAYYDKKSKPKYHGHEKEVKDLSGAILDKKTGVYWKGKRGEDYTSTKKAYAKYVGQKIGKKVYAGFKPDKINKSGKFELYSGLLEKKGFNPLPSYLPVPEHQKMGANDLILTTYKVNVQSHSRTQNCKWLSEIYHDNPAWINPKTAAKRGIKEGANIRIRSSVGEITTKAHLTQGIHPMAVAISNHCGHWAYGRYASGKAVFSKVKGEKVYWKKHGVHPNWIIPNSGDPISGQMRWMDTVVTVKKA